MALRLKAPLTLAWTSHALRTAAVASAPQIPLFEEEDAQYQQIPTFSPKKHISVLITNKKHQQATLLLSQLESYKPNRIAIEHAIELLRSDSTDWIVWFEKTVKYMTTRDLTESFSLVLTNPTVEKTFAFAQILARRGLGHRIMSTRVLGLINAFGTRTQQEELWALLANHPRAEEAQYKNFFRIGYNLWIRTRMTFDHLDHAAKLALETPLMIERKTWKSLLVVTAKSDNFPLFSSLFEAMIDAGVFFTGKQSGWRLRRTENKRLELTSQEAYTLIRYDSYTSPIEEGPSKQTMTRRQKTNLRLQKALDSLNFELAFAVFVKACQSPSMPSLDSAARLIQLAKETENETILGSLDEKIHKTFGPLKWNSRFWMTAKLIVLVREGQYVVALKGINDNFLLLGIPEEWRLMIHDILSMEGYSTTSPHSIATTPKPSLDPRGFNLLTDILIHYLPFNNSHYQLNELINKLYGSLISAIDDGALSLRSSSATTGRPVLPYTFQLFHYHHFYSNAPTFLPNSHTPRATLPTDIFDHSYLSPSTMGLRSKDTLLPSLQLLRDMSRIGVAVPSKQWVILCRQTIRCETCTEEDVFAMLLFVQGKTQIARTRVHGDVGRFLRDVGSIKIDPFTSDQLDLIKDELYAYRGITAVENMNSILMK